MFARHEIALLIVVVLPLAVIVGIDAYLVLHGETDTLLLPGFFPFPSIELDPEPGPETVHEAAAAEPTREALREAA